MSNGPEDFPAVDLSNSGLTIQGDLAPEFLSGGFNSAAWRVGAQVVKITKRSTDHEGAGKLLVAMQDEHNLLENYLGEHVPQTDYSVADSIDGNGSRVVTVQPFIEGLHIKDFLGQPDSPTGSLREFIGRCKTVYHERRLMPDIANIESAFNVFSTPNILLRDDDALPVLVDTTFGTIQRSKILGPVWTRAIYAGAVIAHARLRSNPTAEHTLTPKA